MTRFSFRVRKSLDDFLFWLLPGAWIPLYNAVSFSTRPYKKCQEHRNWQDKVLNRILIAVLFVMGAAIVLSFKRRMVSETYA